MPGAEQLSKLKRAVLEAAQKKPHGAPTTVWQGSGVSGAHPAPTAAAIFCLRLCSLLGGRLRAAEDTAKGPGFDCQKLKGRPKTSRLTDWTWAERKATGRVLLFVARRLMVLSHLARQQVLDVETHTLPACP